MLGPPQGLDSVGKSLRHFLHQGSDQKYFCQVWMERIFASEEIGRLLQLHQCLASVARFAGGIGQLGLHHRRITQQPGLAVCRQDKTCGRLLQQMADAGVCLLIFTLEISGQEIVVQADGGYGQGDLSKQVVLDVNGYAQFTCRCD